AEAVARTAAFIDRWDGRLDGRLRAWAMPFSPETCSAELLQGLKRVVDQRGTGLTLHHGSGPQARKDDQGRGAKNPTEYLEALGVLGPNVLLAHALGLDEAEVDCVARSGAAVTMCPVTAAKGARGATALGRMPELLARSVRVALGCDSPNNSNHLDPVRTMNMAAIQYKDARQDIRLVPAETALEMGTPRWAPIPPSVRRAPRNPVRSSISAVVMGAPRWPPYPPDARGAPAEPWHPSITGRLKEALHVLRAEAVRDSSGAAEGV